jgi:hypothetical protein
MPKGNKLSRLLVATLAVAALAAPSAMAQPIDTPMQQQDMHASTVTKPEAAQQDLRTEASQLPAYPSRAAAQSAQTDLRGENAKPVPSSPRVLPGPPTWPTDPKPIPPSEAPAVADDGDGGGIDLPVALIGIAGVLALAGGLGAVALRSRTRVAH